MSATRKIFVIGSRYSGSKVASPSCHTRVPSGAESHPPDCPATITHSGWPSSSMAREPTRVIPARRNQPPDGSPWSSIRGSRIRYPSPSV